MGHNRQHTGAYHSRAEYHGTYHQEYRRQHTCDAPGAHKTVECLVAGSKSGVRPQQSANHSRIITYRRPSEQHLRHSGLKYKNTRKTHHRTHEKREKRLDDMEQTLAENGIPAKCYQEMLFTLPVAFGENESNIGIWQGTGTTMDMYEYTAGTTPQNTDEIAITRIATDKLGANIGDTVTIQTIDGDKEYIISAFFQSMTMQGSDIRLHCDEYINYVQVISTTNTQIMFTDNPGSKEIKRRIEKIQEIFPDYENIKTCKEAVADMLGVTDVLTTVKSIIVLQQLQVHF